MKVKVNVDILWHSVSSAWFCAILYYAYFLVIIHFDMYVNFFNKKFVTLADFVPGHDESAKFIEPNFQNMLLANLTCKKFVLWYYAWKMGKVWAPSRCVHIKLRILPVVLCSCASKGHWVCLVVVPTCIILDTMLDTERVAYAGEHREF